MRIYLSGIVALVMLFAFGTSCQKEVEGSLVENNDVDSTIIRKYIEFDTTLAAGFDTIVVTTFDYDNSGRLISKKDLEKDIFAPPAMSFPYFKNSILYYNGAAVSPFKIVSAEKNSLGDTHDTAFLFYTNGIVSKDSTRMRQVDPGGFIFESIVVNNYVPNGGNTVVTQYRDVTLNPAAWPPVCPGTTTYQQTILNGNIVSETGSYSSCSGVGNSATNFTYDNKPNPFYPLRIPYPVLDGYVLYGFIQKNNILENWFFSPTDGYKYSYEYRSDGYPLVLRAYETLDPTNAWKGIYVYK
jgi:hypothetical protein